MANPLRAFAISELPVQADSLSLCEIALLQLQLSRQIEQAHFAFLLGENFIKESEVIAEAQNRARIIDWGVAAYELVEENRGHGSDVLVAEPQISTSEAGVPGLNGVNSNGEISRALGRTGGDA